ncbi:MAG: hypothetical protein QOF35_591 [Actinomycetota bacterium]|jgi:hypothetical protein|nr:hypothetical protein [Actinomycetota bacterium]
MVSRMPVSAQPTDSATASGFPSIRLVVPYFGERPAYFPLVMRSMAANPDVSWLLLTEQPVPDAPRNVAVQRYTFDDLANRIRSHFDFEISLEAPYKLCDFRPAFGEIFADELVGYDFWGHSDLDVIFGQIREHLPASAFDTDKILFNGSFSLYRNTVETAGWYRHEVGKVSYRDAMTNTAAMHFDEWAGIYYIVEDLRATAWHEDVIFDISFHQYRTRAETPKGRDPRRYAWERGEVCEYRLERGRLIRRTALLIHLQKRVLRAPAADVLAAERYFILPNGFAVQNSVTPWAVRAARIPHGRELLPFYLHRVQRWRQRRATRRAAAAGHTTVQV